MEVYPVLYRTALFVSHPSFSLPEDKLGFPRQHAAMVDLSHET